MRSTSRSTRAPTPRPCRAAIEDVLPDGLEVITGEQVADENADDVNEFIGVFGQGLLIFAFITAFVSAFIINNVFQITIGQRLRELALMRAVGASGRQVRRMITVESFFLGLTATILGLAGGVLVAKLLVAGFNAAGAGFPSTGIVMEPRTVVMAALVGIGITMGSVVDPRSPRGADPARRGDAPGARVQRPADQAPRRRRSSSRSSASRCT